MYSPPQTFLDRFHAEFGTRLRIRWSLSKHEFHIEEKVARALPPLRIDNPFDDRAIRARDGYAFVMSIKPGTKTACRQCGLDMHVPLFRSAEIKCPYCEPVKNRPSREFGGYWPLTGDRLLNHLKKLDPMRDGHLRAMYEADVADAQRDVTRKRAVDNHIEAVTMENQYQLFSTPRAYMNDATRAKTPAL